MDVRSGSRLRVLISAYACGPVDEPEAAAGWAFAVAAAERHDVWIITRQRFANAITLALDEDPVLAGRIHVTYLDLSNRLVALKRRPRDMYWYYALWQRALTHCARSLHREIGFDVVHHVTFANDWMPCGATWLREVPLVWGPVGGASLPAWQLSRWLGLRGVLTEIQRLVIVAPLRLIFGDVTARRASVVVAQNHEVARRFRHARHVVIEPNVALDEVLPLHEKRRPTPPKRAIFVGRLIGLKGVRLAVAVMAHPLAQDWSLDVLGSGYDQARLEALARDLGVSDRVRFHGHRPRPEVLQAFASADAMLFPSMHDQAGWAVAEASAIGCPVVCLPLGGPPLLAGRNAYIASTRGDVVANLAEALALAGEANTEPDRRWTKDRLPDLVQDWYSSAMQTHQMASSL